MKMTLKNKNAVIYGAGGSLGGAVDKALAEAGANVFLTGRNISSLQKVADEILKSGGKAEVDIVDTLDEKAVNNHIETILQKGGTVDISFNAIGSKGNLVKRGFMSGHKPRGISRDCGRRFSYSFRTCLADECFPFSAKTVPFYVEIDSQWNMGNQRDLNRPVVMQGCLLLSVKQPNVRSIFALSLIKKTLY